MSRPSGLARQIMRVNHAGEYGAIRIYRAQLRHASHRYRDLAAFLTETLAHEENHLQAFGDLMAARGILPCSALALWGLGGAILGELTAKLGRDAVLVCTEAVERTVHGHLNDQLLGLGRTDPELSDVIRDIRDQELGHLVFARTNRQRSALFAAALDWLVAATTETLIWLATRGSLSSVET